MEDNSEDVSDDRSRRLSEDIEYLHHVDFTTASEWEVFIARLEEVILNWNLPNRKVHHVKTKVKPVWLSNTENISFADVNFTVTHHFVKETENEQAAQGEKKSQLPQALEEIMSSELDFLPVETVFQNGVEDTKPHILARWYGLRDFVVITPIKNELLQESKIKLLLSSVCIALSNKLCEVPIFVRALHFWQHFYLGICEGKGIRGEFEMVHLERIPLQCRYLTGLLGIFKSKIGGTFLGEPVNVAARFSFVLNDWSIFEWTAKSPDLEINNGDLPEALLDVPFGSLCEPLTSMTLHTCWPEILESVVVDSEAYSDFDPMEAPIWALSIVKTENPACLLTDYVSEFVLHSTSTSTTEELVGSEIGLRDSGDMLQPLSVLTESKIPSLSNMLTQYASRKVSISSEGPISMKFLLPIIYYLFPDAENNPKHPYTSEGDINKGNSQMKTCAVDSLVWRLAVVLAHALSSLGGLKATVYLWHEFYQELRYRWNTSNLIPGVAPGFPDPKTCLLHQKLQMINCCIERRIKRHEELLRRSKESDESEDEFFDCDESDQESETKGGGDPGAKGDSTSRRSSKSVDAPSGRLAQHETLKLLKTGQPLYIPITQGATPKTEDQSEEDAKVLIQLGTDAEGSQLRAKLMSASLLSDMESFKAANPGAVFEDFIRWCSPRDWIEEDADDEFGQKKGQLSARMKLPGNTWLEVWASARGIPANRQKRLFDETTEGEKALHLIESCDPGDAISMLLPALAHAAIKKISEESAAIPLPTLQTAVLHVTKKLEVITRQAPQDTKRYQELTWEIGQIETLISQVHSLEHKVCCEGVDPSIAWSLVSEPEVTLPGGPAALTATRIKLLFSHALKNNEVPSESGDAKRNPEKENIHQGILKEANEKEFILRTLTPRPTKQSKLCPQRLFAKITKSDITMASLFSQDTTFF
ncbi:rab3 GTPase-activating protein catalytic subunit [Cimex lectularius]|uniref:Rab3 GTPase-activating protein catalytic subunit n=1 Tax=Cimex lectularius TaxID=79782 RepID=A0A8I6S5Y4_CIMLE|nr:rab3 GTPase-activating protein catalytic subunit [Cimex lectularius]